MSAMIAALRVVREDDTVLDVGCGCGSMAFQLRRTLGPRGAYIGFDVHGASIAWCRTQFAADPRFVFELARLETAWSHGHTPATEYQFPADDASVDFVLAKSVFTHLLEPDAAHYLREIRRALRQGRNAIITAFLSESSDTTFRYGGPDAWWKVKSRPEAAVAYRRAHFLGMVRAAGLRVEKVIDGSWSRRGVARTFQDLLLLS